MIDEIVIIVFSISVTNAISLWCQPDEGNGNATVAGGGIEDGGDKW